MGGARRANEGGRAMNAPVAMVKSHECGHVRQFDAMPLPCAQCWVAAAPLRRVVGGAQVRYELLQVFDVRVWVRP